MLSYLLHCALQPQIEWLQKLRKKKRINQNQLTLMRMLTHSPSLMFLTRGLPGWCIYAIKHHNLSAGNPSPQHGTGTISTVVPRCHGTWWPQRCPSPRYLMRGTSASRGKEPLENCKKFNGNNKFWVLSPCNFFFFFLWMQGLEDYFWMRLVFYHKISSGLPGET